MTFTPFKKGGKPAAHGKKKAAKKAPAKPNPFAGGNMPAAPAGPPPAIAGGVPKAGFLPPKKGASAPSSGY